MPSFPVSSQRAFNAFFSKAMINGGLDLIRSLLGADVADDAVSSNAATVNMTNSLVRSYILTSSSAQVFNVNANLDKIAIGDEVVLNITGTGQCTVTAVGTTLTKTAATLKSLSQHAVIRIRKTGVNTYNVSGDLASS